MQLCEHSVFNLTKALRKLYEDIPSDEGDSDADKEVQRLLSGVADKHQLNADSDDGSSVISGSWSRMRAFKNISEAGRGSFKETKLNFDLNSRVKDNKGTLLNFILRNQNLYEMV